MRTWPILCLAVSYLLFATVLRADDWPMRGRDNSRNAVSPEKTPPLDWQAVPSRPRAPHESQMTPRNIRWSATLGSMSLADPVIADGLVWVGTNNEEPRDPAHIGDAAVLMCFREKDGQFLYQYLSPRRPEGKIYDWEYEALGSSPLVEGDRLWFCTNRCEVVCLDIGPLKTRNGQPSVIWKLSMVEELGVVPSTGMIANNGLHCSVASYGGLIYVNTTNGRSQYLRPPRVQKPDAPSLICLTKDAGKVIWKDNSPGGDIFDVQNSNPLVAEVNGRGQVIMGQGDGWLRSFDALTGEVLWEFDINYKSAEPRKNLQWNNLEDERSPAYFMSSPVFHDGRVYAASGRQAEHGSGLGRLVCIDPTKRRNISSHLDNGAIGGKPNPNSGLLWEYLGKEADPMGLTMSSVVIHEDTLIAADFFGKVHCLNAQSGAHYWTQNLNARVWSTPLIVDHRIYVGTEEGEVWILRLAPEKSPAITLEFDSPLRASPVFANGTLYIATDQRLHAIRAASP